jgi:3-isopropylmalate dehydrogenase
MALEQRLMSKKILILAGDGIGPEVMRETKKIISFLVSEKYLDCNLSEDFIGGSAIDHYGVPLHDSTIEKAKQSDCILMGAVGGPKWDHNAYGNRPEAGLLKIRKSLNLFANLRPALVFPALVEASTLKPEIVSGLDILIVRELTGGVYFGTPRGIFDLPNGERQGINTQTYTTSEIHRVGRVAFEMARKRHKKLCSCDKANVMESGKLWREEITILHKQEFPDVELTHMYADNCAMQLLRNPKQFDVIVTDNLFGDILSDEASMLTGSLGLLPSASLNESKLGLYEPVHGSAPDIAGQNKANPIACILSFAMALKYSLEEMELSSKLEYALHHLLQDGYRTADLASSHRPSLSCSEMGDQILSSLKKELQK